jgi:hypothetical protein
MLLPHPTPQKELMYLNPSDHPIGHLKIQFISFSDIITSNKYVANPAE